MWVSDSYEYIYALAESSLARGDYETAQANFERLNERLSKLKPVVLDRRPELRNLRVVSLGKQAEIHHIQGEFEQALELYDKATEIAPETRDRWQRDVALVYIDMGQVEKGLDELRAQAIAHPGTHERWLTIGVEAESLGRLDEAEESLQRAARIASEPDDRSEVYLALFDLYREQGRVEEALAAWDQAWEAHGHDPDYVFPLYQMMWEAGDLEQARQYLDHEENPLRKGFQEGLLASSEGNPEEAARHWQQVTQMNPLEFDEGHEAWAEAALRVDHPPEEVVGVLGTILEAGDFSLRGLLLQAIAEARLGHTEHAEGVLEIARNLGLRTRPRQENLPPAHWTLFDELVTDDDVKGELRGYFQVESGSEVGADQEQG
jgi:tetratricopeptide (TPR) repeat protein